MGIYKQELIGKIHGIEGLSNEEKSALIELLKTHKKYGLVWEDKPENVEERLRDELPVLTEVKERAIISDDPDAPNHILIEGDNLEALTALTYTHAGKIDVIYIDPPYNTGNKDFIYNDSYVDKEDAFRHSKWLSFMERRLRIAHGLLSPQGIVYISIDDNEQAQLKMLCNQIFGEKNLVADAIWKSKSGGANDASFIATDTENILIYAKDSKSLKLGMDEEGTATTSYNREDEFGRYSLDRLDKQSLGYHESLDFPIVGPDGKVYTVEHKDPNNKVARWRWGAKTVEERYDELVFEGNYVYTKNYEKDAVMPRNLMAEERFGRTRSGKTELFSIIGPNSFDNPKPSKLISYLVGLFPDKSCTILDFFAGSGTTMNAVMNLNAKDGGNRKAILCTLNENGICETVAYRRNRNIILGYQSQGKSSIELMSEKLTFSKLKSANKLLDQVAAIKQEQSDNFDAIKVEIKDGCLIVLGEIQKSEYVSGMANNSLRYYKTDFVGRERSSQNMRQLVYAATDLLCIKEDLYNEVKQFGPLKLKSSVARYFEGKDKRMLVIYNELAVPAIAEEIAKMDFSGKVKIYVFAPGNYAYDDEFYEVQNKVELCALPAAIYNAYQKVLPKRKTKLLDGVQEETEQVENNGELNLNFGEE